MTYDIFTAEYRGEDFWSWWSFGHVSGKNIMTTISLVLADFLCHAVNIAFSALLLLVG